MNLEYLLVRGSETHHSHTRINRVKICHCSKPDDVFRVKENVKQHPNTVAMLQYVKL